MTHAASSLPNCWVFVAHRAETISYKIFIQDLHIEWKNGRSKLKRARAALIEDALQALQIESTGCHGVKGQQQGSGRHLLASRKKADSIVPCYVTGTLRRDGGRRMQDVVADEHGVEVAFDRFR